MLSDIEISKNIKLKNITEIADKLGIKDEFLEQYGKYKAKVNTKIFDNLNNDDGKLVLVTAINPTPAGERKNYYYYRFRSSNEYIK